MAADLNGFFLNCFIAGETGATERNGRAYRDTIELTLDGKSVKLVQQPQVLGERARDYRHRAVDTTTVVVANVEADERAEVQDMLTGLSYMLSFATSSDVAFYGYAHEEEPPVKERNAVVAQTGFTRPAIDLTSGSAVREYLERSWEGYRRLEECRQLRVAIDLYVLAETRSLPEELRVATVFILLENLKSTYASARGIPFKDGYFRKPKGKSWSFRALLAEMFKDVGMRQPDLETAVRLRNEIVHAGVSRMPRVQQEDIYEECQDLAREYFLRLFGYTGEFRIYSERRMRTKRI